MNFFSIRFKIMVIILGFFTFIIIAFAMYSAMTTKNYRQLRRNEVAKTVAFESERISRVIAEMERNAIDLALAGKHYYLSNHHTTKQGVSITVENFSAFTDAVGGGIWFEPYMIDAKKQRVCYYAFHDPIANCVRWDPDFETSEYDYHSQMWYTSIAKGLKEAIEINSETGRYNVVWTKPYIDDAGTNDLMTTVGAGIYDEQGKFIGMSTVDWDMQSMVNRMSAIKPTLNSFVLLASPKDDYIITITKDKYLHHIGHSLQSIEWYDLSTLLKDDGINISSFIDDGIQYISFSDTLANGWLFCLQIPAREIFAEIENSNYIFSLVIAGSIILLFVLTATLLSRLINRPLSKLTNAVAELGSGDLTKQIEINSKDEFGYLAVAFNKMIHDLRVSIKQNMLERAEKERIQTELDIAIQIQSSMIPSTFAPFSDRSEFELFASMIPSKEIVGDFYDFFWVDHDTLALVIADVSDKSIHSALFMVIAKTLINNNACSGMTPKQVFESVNNLLHEGNIAKMFITAFLGFLHIPSGRFMYVNAGHNAPIIKQDDRIAKINTKNDIALAMMYNAAYTQHEIVLSAGDGIFLYTDGVTEATNVDGVHFGEQRTIKAMQRHSNLPPKELINSIKIDLENFTYGEDQTDDITMLALKYLGTK